MSNIDSWDINTFRNTKALLNIASKQFSRANELLRYGIRLCQLKDGIKCPFSVRFGILLHIKEDLERLGAKWQAKILNFWIHRFQRTFKRQLQSEKIQTTESQPAKQADKSPRGDL